MWHEFLLHVGTQGAFDWHASPKYSWRTIQSSSLSRTFKVSFWINIYARIWGPQDRRTGILLGLCKQMYQSSYHCDRVYVFVTKCAYTLCIFSSFSYTGAKTSGYPETHDVEAIERRCGEEAGTKGRNDHWSGTY